MRKIIKEKITTVIWVSLAILILLIYIVTNSTVAQAAAPGIFDLPEVVLPEGIIYEIIPNPHDIFATSEVSIYRLPVRSGAIAYQIEIQGRNNAFNEERSKFIKAIRGFDSMIENPISISESWIGTYSLDGHYWVEISTCLDRNHILINIQTSGVGIHTEYISAKERVSQSWGIDDCGVTWTGRILNVSDYEVRLLARMIHAEARGEPYIGQIAVGQTAIDRWLGNPHMTLTQILRRPSAFVIARNHCYTCLQAARDVLAGARAIPNYQVFHFRSGRPNGCTRDWWAPFLMRIYGHWFYGWPRLVESE